MLLRIIRRALVGILLVISALAGTAGADDAPYWPSEIEQRLDEVDSQMVEMQWKLRAARHSGDEKAARELEGAFKELQQERGQLLRATGRLQSE